MEEASHLTFDQKHFLKKLIKTIYALSISINEFIELNLKIKNHTKKTIYKYTHSLLTSGLNESSKTHKTVSISRDLSKEYWSI